MSLADQATHLRAYEGLTREAARQRPDLIVWPSSSLPAPITSSRLVQFTLDRLARETGAYLLVGGTAGDKLGAQTNGYAGYSTSQFLISPAGRLQGQYNKIRLTPFDEYLPLEGLVPWPRWITTLQGGFVPGDTYALLPVSRARVAAPICWESIFPDVFRRFVRDGAQLMISATNEGFFGRTAAPHQTLAMNVFRAVENRVAIARAATTGVSAFISPKGDVIERVRGQQGDDLFVAGVLVRDLPLSTERTFYTVYGDVFAHAVIGATALIVLASRWPGRDAR
jgi:apolipoprotein N-acyltransferase